MGIDPAAMGKAKAKRKLLIEKERGRRRLWVAGMVVKETKIRSSLTIGLMDSLGKERAKLSIWGSRTGRMMTRGYTDRLMDQSHLHKASHELASWYVSMAVGALASQKRYYSISILITSF